MADRTPTELAQDLREGKISWPEYKAALSGETLPGSEQSLNASAQSGGVGGTAGPTPVLNAGTFTIGPQTVSPAAPPVSPGVPQMQPQGGAMPPAMAPGDAALAALIQQRGAPGHAAGLSPADKARLTELQQRGAGFGEVTDQATKDITGIQDQLAQQNWVLDQQTRLAQDMHARGMQRDAERRARIEAEHKERSSKIADQLSALDAQNINPNAYWQNRSTPTKFAGALAVAFSTFGSQYGKGGTNAALEIFNHAIDQEIDAQRMNLQKSLNVAKSRMELEGSDWDHDLALLKAERDSTETAYQVAMRQVDSTAARYKDNAAFQAKAVEVKAGLKLQDQDKIGALNDQIYQIMKRGETVIGGGASKIAQQIIERTQALRDKAHADGRELTPEQARNEAAREILGVNMRPGEGEPQLGKVEKSGEGAKTTVLVNGQPMQAINEEQAKSFSKFQEAYPEEKRLHQVLTDAWAKQDWGRYQQARSAFIELAPRVYGFTRGPSGAQAGEGSHDDASIKATVAGQLPEMGVIMNNPHYWGGRGATMLSQVGEHLNSIYDNMWRSTFTAPSPGNPLGLERR